MAKPSVGTQVVAIKDIGGFLRPHIPKGTRGVVTKAGWGEFKVLFTIGKMFGGTEQHEIDVDTTDVS
ncbi:hypothetical protein RI685_16215 (plasmid) [Clavibacter michiganensis]|uniref:hypothetical protein n=1 Tax=Clavibacter michiganensis TaxID=28447 RepID=UPI003DA1AC8B